MSSRNHTWREDAFECGEGPTCSWIPLAAAAIGAAGSYFAAKEANKGAEEAAEKNAEAAKPQFNPMVEPYIRDLLGDAKGIYGREGFAPDPNALQLLGRENALGYGEGYLPGLIGQAQGSWQGMLNPSMNPYVEQMIAGAQNNLNQNFMRNTLPAIGDQSQSTGGYGGSRQGVAQGLAAEGLAEAQANSITGILNNAYNTGQGTQLRAMGMSPMMTELGFMPSSTQQSMGGLYRADAMNPATNLQGYAGILGPFGTMGSGGTPYTTPTSPLMAGVGGGMAGFGLGQSWNQANSGNTTAAPNDYYSSNGFQYTFPGQYS